MKELFELLKKIGPTEGTALILGESGVGKELVARALHQLSPRTKHPFVAINCGAISKELVESELFGHEKGAFTGAQNRHEGAFAQANGGTLFLDEIGELPLELQPKLLRVLENRTYRRVGGSEDIAANVRILAATHQNLSKKVQDKQFRQDLFFRLFVLPILIPPLRERKQDIPYLAQSFLREFSLEAEPKTLSASALELLHQHNFPGNVREFRNILLRSVTLSSGSEIQAEHIMFPDNFISSLKEQTAPIPSTLEEMERSFILEALKSNSWNKAQTAINLGIAKSTLFAKIKTFGLQK